jgi:hypothetical protein
MTDRFAIVPVPDGQPLPPEAIMIGPLSEVLEYIRGTPAREEAEQRQIAREQQVADVANRVADIGAHFMDEIEALAAEKEEQVRLEAKRKADQERQATEDAACEEAAMLREYLETHPDPNAPADDGELEINEPPDKERYGGPEIEEDAGGVPLAYPPIPTTYIKGTHDQTGDLPAGVERRSPAPLGSDPVYDPAELAHAKDPKQVPQPTAVSLW